MRCLIRTLAFTLCVVGIGSFSNAQSYSNNGGVITHYSSPDSYEGAGGWVGDTGSYVSGGSDAAGTYCAPGASCDSGNYCDSGGYCDSICGSSSRGKCSMSGLRVSGFVDALFLDRDAADDLGGNGLVSLNSGPVIIDNGDLDPSIETGYRVGINLSRNDCVNVELLWAMNEWDERQGYVGANDVNSVLGTVDYLLADQVQIGYESEMENFELNRWVQFRKDFSMMIGFRYFSLDEQFILTSFDSGFRSDYQIDTDNNLFGAQLGGRFQRATKHDSIFFNLTGKAGLFGNNAEQQVRLGDVNNTIATRNFSNDDDAGAFVGEVDANLSIKLINNAALRVGYQLLVADAVALAPEQFQQDATVADAAIDNDGSLLMHGAYVGIHGAW